MRLFKCENNRDKRDMWYELDIGHGNKTSIRHAGQGRFEFWGGFLPEDHTKTLLFDTELQLTYDSLFSSLNSLFCSATGQTEFTSKHVTPISFIISVLMYEVEFITERSGEHWGHKGKIFSDLFKKQQLEAQEDTREIVITQTASGINGTYSYKALNHKEG